MGVRVGDSNPGGGSRATIEATFPHALLHSFVTVCLVEKT